MKQVTVIIQIDECHREQHGFVSLSLLEMAVLILAEKVWLLSKSSLTFRGFAVPAESLQAYPLPSWTLLASCLVYP